MEELRSNLLKDLTELANRYILELWILANPIPGEVKFVFCNIFTDISKTITIDLEEVMDNFDEKHNYQGLIKSIEEFLLTHLFECEIID